MDMQMYNLIKDAIKNGKSIEDVVSEINTMAETAKKELEPAHPLLEKYGRRYLDSGFNTIALNPDGTVCKSELVTLLARYYVQNGFDPDATFDGETEFLDRTQDILDNGLQSLKLMQRINTMIKDGAADDEIAGAMFRHIGNMIDGTFSKD